MVLKVWLCAVLVPGEVVGAPAGAVAAGDAEALGYRDGSGVIAPSGFTSPGLGAKDASGEPEGDGVGVAETVGLGDDVRSGVAMTGVGAAVGSAPKPNGVQATAITATHTVSAATISFSIFLLI